MAECNGGKKAIKAIVEKKLLKCLFCKGEVRWSIIWSEWRCLAEWNIFHQQYGAGVLILQKER